MTNVCFISVPSCVKAAINDILQLDVYYDFTHGLLLESDS